MLDYAVFQNQNPWRNELDFFKRQHYLKRTIFNELIKWLDDEEILVLTGSRQVGKSTLMLMLIKYLIEKKNVNPHDIFYFNLDELNLRNTLQNTALLLDFLQVKTSDQKRYLFIDEFQKLPDAGNFIKAIYDLHKPLKIIVSGSSSLKITQTRETLTGRKQVFHIYPFGFDEFVNFKNPDLLEIENIEITGENLKQLFREFLTYGGYPRVILETDHYKKEMKLMEIFNSYLEKDIINLLKIDNVEKFNKLIYLLSNQVGNLVNKNEISNTLALNLATVERYLNLLTGTYVFDLVPPYFSNPRKEISKMPKIYINDLGLKNIIDTRSLLLREDGAMIENFVYNELKKSQKGKLYFWRTTSKAEVDFLAKTGDTIIPIEVKYTERKPLIKNALLSFYKKYHPRKIVIITKDVFADEKFYDCEVCYIPVYLLPKTLKITLSKVPTL